MLRATICFSSLFRLYFIVFKWKSYYSTRSFLPEFSLNSLINRKNFIALHYGLFFIKIFD